MKNYHLYENQSVLWPWVPIIIAVLCVAVYVMAIREARVEFKEPPLVERCAVWKVDNTTVTVNIKDTRLIRKHLVGLGKDYIVKNCRDMS